MAATAITKRRELAHRSGDGIDVSLFWSKPSNWVTIAVVDTRSNEALEFDVDGSAAIDVFNHPYAYAAALDVRNLVQTRTPCDRLTAVTHR
jgi:hypothetical protein